MNRKLLRIDGVARVIEYLHLYGTSSGIRIREMAARDCGAQISATVPSIL
jgi:hypothetical protein